jgi:2-polyprenyl-6-methoxyphenol hydroxylase-like FAD-dependent oxidoreductase
VLSADAGFSRLGVGGSRHAEIAGAGLGGLAVSIALAQRGWTVRVHERAAELRMFGAGIWLWENGLRSLDALGVAQEATRNAVHIETLKVRDETGRELMGRSFDGRDRMLLPPRADLYDALVGRAEALGVDLVTSSIVASASPDGTLHLSEGTSLPADLVIAADGAFSRVRESLMLTRRVDYLDEGYIRLLIPRRSTDPADEITEYWNGNRRLLYDPCTDAVNYVCLCCGVDDTVGQQVPVDHGTWLESFPNLEGIIERFDDAGRWDRAIRVTCRRWSRGQAAVVGDAAHAQPPNLGQGANLTFQNAVSLASYLDQSADVATGLVEWESRERPLTDHVQRWTDLYGRVASAWPKRLESYRTNILQHTTKMQWVDRQLNKAARHVPVGTTGQFV